MCCLATSSFSTEPETITNNNDKKWILNLNDARLRYPGTKSSNLHAVTMEIQSLGGHALLGRNTAGKSLLLHALMDPSSYLEAPSSFRHNNDNPFRPLVERVSFESHSAALKQGGSVYKFLGGHLSPPVQFLVVRLGITSLLKREINHLSTGEIRKVILVRALGIIKPRILILDNAFDGLDVESREILKDLVDKIIAGFKMDILVQGINASTVPPTQILLATHRKEEIVDRISRVTYMANRAFVTEARGGRSGVDLMNLVHDENEQPGQPWDDWNLPPLAAIQSHWHTRNKNDAESPIVETKDFSLTKNGNNLLVDLTWRVNAGERWLVAGGNGAGKSSLSRLLVEPVDKFCVTVPSQAVGWVSTERHMSLAHSESEAYQILLAGVIELSQSLQDVVLDYFELTHMDRPFCRLSQGEQKLVLIAQAILKRPQLLVIDEPLQGLDAMNRCRVLGLIERICEATDVSLVYVTHHYEEVIPSVSHVLHLVDGRMAYTGVRENYNPKKYKDS